MTQKRGVWSFSAFHPSQDSVLAALVFLVWGTPIECCCTVAFSFTYPLKIHKRGEENTETLIYFFFSASLCNLEKAHASEPVSWADAPSPKRAVQRQELQKVRDWRDIRDKQEAMQGVKGEGKK